MEITGWYFVTEGNERLKRRTRLPAWLLQSAKLFLTGSAARSTQGGGHNSFVLQYFFLFVSLLLLRNIRKYIKCFPRDVMIPRGEGAWVFDPKIVRACELDTDTIRTAKKAI